MEIITYHNRNWPLFPHSFASDYSSGWVRLWRGGLGIAWKRAHLPMVYTERYGYHPTLLTVFGRRFRLLPPWK